MAPELNIPPAANNTPTCLTKDLNEDIDIQILKNELSSKNKIIEIMQERNTIDCVKDIQKKESDINKNSKGYVKPKTITEIGDSCIRGPR